MTRRPDTRTRYATLAVAGLEMFYREAGAPDAPVILLLHGYPSSSRMFEPLFAPLAQCYRLIAPDYPGFGLSQAPARERFTYSFESLARVLVAFTDQLGLSRYSLYLQDYGGPLGMRLALARPQRLRALIVQNAVLHEVGLTALWEGRRAYWAARASHEPSVRATMFSIEAGKARHIGGRAHPERYNPDLWMDEIAFLSRPGMDAIQLDLMYDYQSNLRCYPAWQAFLRAQRPPLLVLWGIHDPIFAVAGAQALAREQPQAELHLLEAGHFAINDCADGIASRVREFLARLAP